MSVGVYNADRRLSRGLRPGKDVPCSPKGTTGKGVTQKASSIHLMSFLLFFTDTPEGGIKLKVIAATIQEKEYSDRNPPVMGKKGSIRQEYFP
jgi:hypothetical protein